MPFNVHFCLIYWHTHRDGVSFFTEQHRESIHTSPCTVPGLHFEKQRVSVSTWGSSVYQTKQYALDVLYLMCHYSKGLHRFLTIWKKDRPESTQSIMTFSLTHNSKHVVRNLLQRFPVSGKECTDLLQHTERGLSVSPEAAGKHLCPYCKIILNLKWYLISNHDHSVRAMLESCRRIRVAKVQ